MSQQPNIAFVGRMAAGKSTLANLLGLFYGYVRVSHADGIKEMAALAYGPIDKVKEYTVATRAGGHNILTGREILQGIGQTVKYLDRDFWIKTTLNRAAKIDGPVVNDDTRFVFEADALRDAGWLIVGVDTPDEVRMQRYEELYGRRPTESELSHESEREIDAIICDRRIDGTADPVATLRGLMDSLTAVVG